MNEVELYLSEFPIHTQDLLRKIRAIVAEIAPKADEQISYGIPSYKINGKPFFYFAGFKKHIGIYATPDANIHFGAKLSGYKQGKGSIQFPLKEEIPFDLIKEIIRFKLQQLDQKNK